MSTLIVEVCKIEKVLAHENAYSKNLCKNLLLLAIKAYGTLLPERLKRCTMEASRTSLALA
jgi:hypothetical protein